MTRDEASHTKTFSHVNYDYDYCLSCPVTELISEEKKPSLYSLSLTDSVCSDSIMDLNVIEQKTPKHPHLTSTLSHRSSNEDTFQSCGEVMEESLIVSAGKLHNKFRKCMSLHDVSTMIPSQLIPKSVNTVSCETIQSHSLSSTTKSKDSGFHRSVSCLSLTSGKKNYDHIESKVKAYIRNIKDSEALRKKNKLKQQSDIEIANNPEIVNNAEMVIADDSDFIIDKEDLLIKIQELKHELHEKSLYIDAQQKNYNNLLLKYAEAKNTIDALRLQRISLNYSSVNESQNMSSTNQNTNFDFFIQELCNKKSSCTEFFKSCSNDESSVLKEKYLEKKQESESSPISNSSITEDFKPRKHSTPDKSEVCLSPVIKLCSSSSRLDKTCKPLVKQGNHSNVNSTLTKPCNTFSKAIEPKSLARNFSLSSTTGLMNNGNHFKSKQSKNSILKKKLRSHHIDLPNDDPFVKVKMWQDSLPNINLLGSHSSSDHENVFTAEQDEDINSLLSQQLVAKCKISEMGVVSEHKVCQYASSNLTNSKEIKSHRSINDDNSSRGRSKTNKSLKIKKSDTHKGSHKIEKCSTNVFFSKFKGSVNAVREDSISEGESHSYNPRSSYTNRKGLKSDSSDNTSDSSSLSSLVLSSSLSSPSKKSKRKHMQNKSNITRENPKHCSNTRTCSNFVLRKPVLNAAMPIDRFSKLTGHKSLQNLNSHNSNLSSTHLNLKTESSQRKAWNARNDTNFYVCKDFYFKKSNSLQNCITVMEGMVEKSSSILGEMLDRSICK